MWVAGLVLSPLLAVAAYLALAGPEEAQLPGAGTRPPAAVRDDAAAELLAELRTAVTSGSAAELRGLAAPGDAAATRELKELRRNVRRLSVTDLTLRYVDSNEGRTAADGSPLPSGQWVGDVALEWRLDGYDEAPSRMEVTMIFAETTDGAAFVTARPDYGSPAPLWLLRPLAVERGRESLVMAAGDDVGQYGDLAERAVVDVRKVLPSWEGDLVVAVPGSERELDRVVGSTTASWPPSRPSRPRPTGRRRPAHRCTSSSTRRCSGRWAGGARRS